MLTLILSIVGPLVLAGGALTFVPGVGLLAKLVTVRGFLGRVPRPVWIALAVAFVLGAGVLWHKHKAGAAIAAAEKRGEERSDKRHKAIEEELARRAVARRRQAEALSAEISRQEREKNETNARRLGAIADALRVHGPGRAACSIIGGDPGLSGGAGGHGAPGGAGGAPATRVPYPDGFLLGVPHQWAVNTAEQCDLNRSEALTWREHDRRQREAWERMLAEGAKK